MMSENQPSRPDSAYEDARFEKNLMQSLKKQVTAHFFEALAPWCLWYFAVVHIIRKRIEYNFGIINKILVYLPACTIL